MGGTEELMEREVRGRIRDMEAVRRETEKGG